MTADADRVRWSALKRFVTGAERDPFTDDAARQSAGRFGMWLLLLSLAVIFIATLLAYVIVRLSPVNEATWVPADAGGLPRILILSTVILVLSSATMHLTLLAAQRDRRSVGAWSAATLALGMLFLGCQFIAWRQATQAGILFDESLYAYTFYVLTGLHAVHVLGGLIPLTVTTTRALRGRYTAHRHAGVLYCAMYWHFLGGAWLVLYPALLWGSR